MKAEDKGFERGNEFAGSRRDSSGKKQDTESESFSGNAGSSEESGREAVDRIFWEQKAKAADALGRMAAWIRECSGQAGAKLEEEAVALGESAADRVDDLAERVRSREMDEIIMTLGELGRRHKGLFLAGAAAGGFLLARMLVVTKSSED